MAKDDTQHLPEQYLEKTQTFFHLVWLDYISTLVFVPVTLVIWRMPIYHSNARVVQMSPWTFADNLSDFEPGLRSPLELAYPWRPEPLPSWACGVVVVLIPLLVVCSFQFKSRNLSDLHAGTSGALKAVVAT
jgi:hypothetical protein